MGSMIAAELSKKQGFLLAQETPGEPGERDNVVSSARLSNQLSYHTDELVENHPSKPLSSAPL